MNERKNSQACKVNRFNNVNEFAVKGKNNRIRILKNLDSAIKFAIKWFQREIRWQNSDIIITVAEMMNPERSKFLKEIIEGQKENGQSQI